MGTTVRREPVVSKIPKAQDYKYLNITDFRGISKSSNPFTQPYNTASDALNVYVDETNALTTRPRLEKFADITQLDEIVAAFNITVGFLIQGKKNNNWKLYVKTSTGISEVTVPTGVTLNAKITAVFEQDGKIYFINGSNYYVITVNNGAYTVNYVEGYVPTTIVGSTLTTKGAKYESLNVLSNKYKESYFWDGTWNPLEKLDVTPSQINYSDLMKTASEHFQPLNNTDYFIQIDKCLYEAHNDLLGEEYDTSSEYFWMNFKYFGRYRASSGGTTNYGIFAPYFEANVLKYNFVAFPLNGYDHYTPISFTISDIVDMDCSVSGKYAVCIIKNEQDTSNYSKVYELDLNYDEVAWSLIDSVAYANRFTSIKVNNNNSVKVYKSVDYKMTIRLFNNYARVSYDSGYDGNIEISDNGDLIGMLRGGTDSKYKYYCMKKILSAEITLENQGGGNLTNVINRSFEDVTLGKRGWTDSTSYKSWDISPDGSIVTTTTNRLSVKIWYDFLNHSDKTAEISIQTDRYDMRCIRCIKLAKDNSKIYILSTSDGEVNNGNQVNGWISLNEKLENDSKIYELEWVPFDFEQTGETTYGIYATKNNYPVLYADNSKLLWLNKDAESYNRIMRFSGRTFSVDSIEPVLKITKQLHITDAEYNELNKLTNILNASSLTTRFNNEHWFASGNKTFYTQYNDPTYIPMKSYNINGDQDDITAMNVLSDSILGLYKKDDLWLVQQTYDSNGDVVYYYNENNNVVGNDAFNAAITTIHSNLPIQITYDGIYTIQQQENVSAPDRLARSISDAIAELWQSETDSVVAKAITLNRLYWTYILLPYADFTKVYLLDNRTLSWYYWELPIVLASAFVKDNKVYFATKDSMLVTLETSDVTKILSQNASISEYYDLDRQLINWYWQSQILPLGTINYTKKLINTTFIVTDTDENDGYSLQYQFNVFRRKMGVTNVKNITNKLNYVQSVTKKTFISRFNFIQLKLSNMYDDLDNNKLRLVGLGLKYELLEGML